MSVRNRVVDVLRRLGLLRLVVGLHRLWLGLVKVVCRLTGRPVIDAIYNDRYFTVEEAWTEPTAGAVVDVIVKEFRPASVADVGCGTAVYLRHFKERGVSIQGYEGSTAAIDRAQVPATSIQRCDLTKPLQVDRQYDLALCFEVAEHLPDAAADTLVGSMVSLAPVILFSAAQPGQGGVDHINEQPGSYWIAKYEAAGCRYDEPGTEKLRAAMTAADVAWWLKTNLMVFRRARPAS